MIREKYDDLVFACKCLAAFLETHVDIKEYNDYGWAQIAFKTDNFGGVYTILHYDFGTGNLRKDFGTEKELDISRLCDLYQIVKDDLERELKERDLNYISEMINAEYD